MGGRETAGTGTETHGNYRGNEHGNTYKCMEMRAELSVEMHKKSKLEKLAVDYEPFYSYSLVKKYPTAEVKKNPTAGVKKYPDVQVKTITMQLENIPRLW